MIRGEEGWERVSSGTGCCWPNARSIALNRCECRITRWLRWLRWASESLVPVVDDEMSERDSGLWVLHRESRAEQAGWHGMRVARVVVALLRDATTQSTVSLYISVQFHVRQERSANVATNKQPLATTRHHRTAVWQPPPAGLCKRLSVSQVGSRFVLCCVRISRILSHHPKAVCTASTTLSQRGASGPLLTLLTSHLSTRSHADAVVC